MRVQVDMAPSGLTPVTGNLAAVGAGGVFKPIAGRPFNVTLSGAFVGSVQLERSFDGANWFAAATARTAPDSFVCCEYEAGVSYRVNFTARTSGSVDYRLSQ